ncbi:hypothetical protein V8B97DRAFT_1956581 [Scleroderma yunnanense]
MSNCPPQNDPNSHLQQIRSLITYFETEPVKHFDEQDKHLLSQFSELHGAITLPTSGMLRPRDVLFPNGVLPEGEANRDDEDAQFVYVNRDGKDRKSEFLCKGQCADGTSCNRPVSFDSCADHLDRYHDTSSSKDVQCPWCGQTKSRKNLARHYQEVHLRFPRRRHP